jgi:two-component system CheB/CheR fusion protein
MPADADPGMAFVLVQHLAPDHKSILTDLVKRYTRMQVFEVEDGMTVQRNCAYIIPPNKDMAFMNGTLQLLEPAAPRGLRLPIDFFFRSLAYDQHERAICIVLSGTGSDGTQGLRAVKGEGGMVMAQNPESTEFDGMPRSAIGTGMVDFVLPPAEMASQLISYSTRAYGSAPHVEATPTTKTEDAYKKIFVLLRSHIGHDFSRYKKNTINRRVERRMAVHQIDGLDSYVRYLQKNPAELEALFNDLLIGVTNFFRDKEAFAALEEKIIPQLFVGKHADAGVRVWVTGCSTGEEAYSIAILIQEHMETLKKSFKVQVFASDIDGRAIETARAGIYPASIAADISVERLARFFSQGPDSSSYRVQKVIRDMLVFSEQDVIKDPPFSKLDLISCRNLLIYMSADLQKKLIPIFHYSLKQDGYLFLGTSETIGEFTSLFSSIDRKAKLYQRKGNVLGIKRIETGGIFSRLREAELAPRFPDKRAGDGKTQLRELTERALLQHLGAIGVLINERGDILYLHGRTGQYLEPAPGESGMNILKMAREGLKRELSVALHKAVKGVESARHAGVRVKTNGDFTTVNLTVRSLPAPQDEKGDSRLFLVVLEEAGGKNSEQSDKSPFIAAVKVGDNEADVDARIESLKQELKDKDDYLQSANEELETANEELKSSNEEMQSVNEELQSTNEELETSKEELQSVNEELATVNAELQAKVADLTQANNDMNNLLAGSGIGTIFVDYQLRIQRFTPPVTQLINLILSDVGRPVGHIVSNLTGYDSLVADIQSVLDNLTPKEVEVQTKAGAWYLLRIRPYRTLDNVIEGAVITFTEITEVKKAQSALRETETLRRLAVVVRDAYDAITVQDLEGRIIAWNQGAVRMYGWSEVEALKMNIRDLIPADKRDEALDRIRQLSQAEILAPYLTQRITKDGAVVEVSMISTALVNEAGQMYAIATTERLVT